MKFNTNELRSLAILENLPEKLYTWLSDQGTRIELAAQEHLFPHDHPANFMFIIVSGKIQRYQEIDGQTLIAATPIQAR